MGTVTKKSVTHEIKKILFLSLSLIITFGLITACEGPSGSEGPQGPEGPEGPEGPVGPAGEDGSMMYSGQGAPGSDVGSEGDYYLNTNTGEMYGPKESSGWGNPIMVLMGQDGEDGSQIHSGTSAPSSSVGVEGDYYLDKSSYELYGPKSSSGWGTPINLKGADGNANVTRYIFPGYDFSSIPDDTTLNISDVETPQESAWEVYLGEFSSEPNMYHIPGWGISAASQYSVKHTTFSTNGTDFTIELANGTGEEYQNIYIVQIGANSTEDQTKQKPAGEGIIPDELDVTNYQDMADYYGFRSE